MWQLQVLVMPFGLPTSVQDSRKLCCASMQIHAFIFLDDILVFLATFETHFLDVENVFKLLQRNVLLMTRTKNFHRICEVS